MEKPGQLALYRVIVLFSRIY